ncbi:MAG: hypothetical protein LiPW39_262 [Parcubacteria group bacterium LiPW_39]|nr:MAG: hypothetical protein LiPW39_262 [Parcubacteria group bacterium LiPW_39]
MSKKILLIAIIFIAVAFLIFIGYFYGYPLYQKWQIQRQGEKFLEEYTKPYKEDIYGGVTPEETWNMFLEALRKGDVELAAKYFEVREQDKKLEWLRRVKSDGLLDDMIGDLTVSPLHLSSDTDEIAEYTISDKDKKIIVAATFIKNNFTNIWKISSL